MLSRPLRSTVSRAANSAAAAPQSARAAATRMLAHACTIRYSCTIITSRRGSPGTSSAYEPQP